MSRASEPWGNVVGTAAGVNDGARPRRQQMARPRHMFRGPRVPETGTVGLGQMQRGFLREFVAQGQWPVLEGIGVGWMWANFTHMVRMCESCVRRGLAVRAMERGALVYRPTELARRWADDQG